MEGMDHLPLNDADLTSLMKFHAAKRRLAVMVDTRKRRGQPTEDLELELALNRLAARAFAALLTTSPKVP